MKLVPQDKVQNCTVEQIDCPKLVFEIIEEQVDVLSYLKLWSKSLPCQFHGFTRKLES